MKKYFTMTFLSHNDKFKIEIISADKSTQFREYGVIFDDD